MKQLGRFLRLERVRPDSERELPVAPSRFSTLEEARAVGSAAQHSAAGLERFGPEPDPELELEPSDVAEPFVRCPHCRADSVRHATVCRQCEARLDTDEVRAFNARLWAEMTVEREREAQELRERESLRRSSTAVRTSVPEETSPAELAAREEARRALEAPFGWGSRARWLPSGANAGLLQVLVVVALGLPIVVAFSRRSAGVGWAVLLVAAGALALLAARRRR